MSGGIGWGAMARSYHTPPDESDQNPSCTALASSSSAGPRTSIGRPPRAKTSRHESSNLSGESPVSAYRPSSLRAYTTRPTPPQKIDPAHMGHGSVLVYSVQRDNTFAENCREARRIKLSSAWPVQSCSELTVFSASSSTLPRSPASTAPKG